MAEQTVIEGFRLSPQQEHLWGSRPASGVAPDRALATVRTTGQLDAATLVRALGDLAARHEILRTRLRRVPGLELPLQVVADGGVELTVEDLGPLPGTERRSRQAELTAALEARPWDLESGGLLRALLLRLADDDHLLLLAAPALAADRPGLAHLVGELVASYQGAAGEGRDDGAEVLQYADVSEWQRSLLDPGGAGDDEDAAASRRYWRRQRPGRHGSAGDDARSGEPWDAGCIAVPLTDDLGARLERVAAELGVPAPALLLTAWCLLLSRLEGAAAAVVGVAFDGRNYEELAASPGLLSRHLPVAAGLAATAAESAMAFAATLAAHGGRQEYYPLPAAPCRYAFEAGELPPPMTTAEVTWRLLCRRSLWDRNELKLVAERRGRGDWELELEHDRAAVADAGAMRLAQRYTVLLDRLLATPAAPLAGVEVLTVDEAARLEAVNATAADLPGPRTLHGLVRAQAERTPGAVALSMDGAAGVERWTYGELWQRVETLASRLRRRGVAPGVRVGLAVERSPAMVLGMVGILEAGGAYLPLDPEYPRQRLEWMLADAAAPVLVTTTPVLDWFEAPPGTVVRLDAAETPKTPPPGAATAAEPAPATPDDDAYVIYTSGSTGRPKGVVVSHRAITNRLLWMQRRFPFGGDDRLLQKTPYGFDASLWEIFVPLLAGGRLELARPDGHRDAGYLLSAVRERRITVLQLVPSQLAVFLDQAGAAAACAGLRRLFCGGEALPAALARRAADEFGGEAGGCRVVNLYGPTEVSIDATFRPLGADPPDTGVVPIGGPLSNVRVHVVDGALRRLPPGPAGELLIGGDGLARGYLGQPRLTAERFVPDPFAATPGARLYRSGDLARWVETGAAAGDDGGLELDFVGRADAQVKLRGVRVELGEVESVLAAHPGLREAAAAVRESAPGDPRLVAWAVPTGPAPAVAAVFDFLRRHLPDAMLPSHLTLVDELPRLPNGKLDRASLPEPRFGDSEEDFLAPRTPLEELLAGVWSRVLRVDRVGVRDDFFRLGGHSLAATRVLTRVRQAVGAEIGLRELLAAPTVESLAERIESAATEVELPPLVPVPRDGELPLSFAQQRHWFLHQLDPASPLYNLTEALELRGALDVVALAAALRRVVDRHEVLRTALPADADGEPRQRVVADVRLQVPVADLGALPAARRDSAAEDLAALAATTPFDLAEAPLIRVLLIRLAGDRHRLVVVMHHTVSDAEAFATLHGEVEELYAALRAGRPPRLPELPVQYADYAHWQRRALAAAALPRWIDDLRRTLAGAPAEIPLPFDRPRPAEPAYESRWHHFTLPRGSDAALAELGREAGATLFMTLFAVFAAVLHRLSGQHDLVIGTPIVLRDRAEVENLVGCFLNALALRVDASGDPTFADFLARVRSAVLDAFARKDVPFEKLVEEINPPRERNLWPLFQVVFNLKTEVGRALRLPGVEVEPLDADRALPTKYDLTLYLERRDGRITGSLAYKAALFDAPTVERMMDEFVNLLTSAAERPELPLSRLELRPQSERKRVMSDDRKRDASKLEKLMGTRRRKVSVAPTELVDFGYLEGFGKLPRLATPKVESADPVEWATANRETIEEELAVHGAILFRGFAVPGPQVFEEFSRAVAPELLNYVEGSSPRIMVTDRVYTSTEYPPEYFVSMHNELSYAHRWPARLLFHCVVEPLDGGETPIADSRRVLQELPPELKERFMDKGVVYTRNLHGGRGAGLAWQTVFETDDRERVERYCREGNIEFEWLDNGGLRTRQVRPAVIRHPKTGEALWFNQVDQFHPSNLGVELSESLSHVASEEDLPINAYFGDGSPLDAGELDVVRKTFRRVMVAFPWKQGDVLLLDNMLVAHGRMPFSGPRKVVVAMGTPVDLVDVETPQSAAEVGA